MTVRSVLAAEESAGATFLRLDGSAWTTDKDGLAPALLAAEITARSGRDPGEVYRKLAAELGDPVSTRVEAKATPAQKKMLSALSPQQVQCAELAGEKIEHVLSKAPGNQASIGGLKVVTASGWFAARPSGTEDIYKIYAESFKAKTRHVVRWRRRSSMQRGRSAIVAGNPHEAESADNGSRTGHAAANPSVILCTDQPGNGLWSTRQQPISCTLPVGLALAAAQWRSSAVSSAGRRRASGVDPAFLLEQSAGARQMRPATGFYHFLHMQTGRRAWQCELSTIDTTFFLAGALAAGCSFDDPANVESEIRRLADALYLRVDWQWAQDNGGGIDGMEAGIRFLPNRWDSYDEALLLLILGLGCRRIAASRQLL